MNPQHRLLDMNFDSLNGIDPFTNMHRNEYSTHRVSVGSESIIPDGHLSLAELGSTVPSDSLNTLNSHHGHVGSGAIHGGDPLTLQTALAAYTQDETDYWEAKTNQSSVEQTILTLNTQREELKAKLKQLKDEISNAKTAQSETESETEAKDAKRQESKVTLDKFLYSWEGESMIENVSFRRPPPQRAGTEAPLPRRPSLPIRKRQISACHSNAEATGSPPKKKVAKKRRINREDIIEFSLDADSKSPNSARAKTLLVDAITKTSLAELRQILAVPNQSYVRSCACGTNVNVTISVRHHHSPLSARSLQHSTVQCLTSYESLDIMRALCRGKIHLRADLQVRLRDDLESRRWLCANQGNVLRGRVMEDRQKRCVSSFLFTLLEGVGYVLLVPGTHSFARSFSDSINYLLQVPP